MKDRFIEECRNDLLQMNGGISANQSTTQNRSTKTDNKLKANLSIRETWDTLIQLSLLYYDCDYNNDYNNIYVYIYIYIYIYIGLFVMMVITFV